MQADQQLINLDDAFRIEKYRTRDGEEYHRPGDIPFEIVEGGKDKPTIVSQFDEGGRLVCQLVDNLTGAK